MVLAGRVGPHASGPTILGRFISWAALKVNVRRRWLLLFLLLFVLFYAAILYSTTQPVGAFTSAPYLPTATNFHFALTYGFVGSLLAAGVATVVLRTLYVGIKRLFS